MRPDHDWGGDFAQYLQQAENISKGEPFYASRYIFNKEAPVYGPPCYPPAYPMLLAPVVKFSGMDFRLLLTYQTILLACFGLVSYFFLKRYFHEWTALLLSLLILYNPWMLDFKSEILSDIPFALFLILLLNLYLFRKDNKLYRIGYLGFLTAFVMLFRSIGMVFILALALKIIVSQIRYKKTKSSIQEPGNLFFFSLILFSLVIWAIFKFIIFPAPYMSESSYLGFVLSDLNLNNIPANATYYMMMLQQYFSPLKGNFAFLSIVVSSLSIILGLTGLIRALSVKITFREILFISYLMILLIYPYRGSGFRFLLPVLPLILYYMISGTKFWLEKCNQFTEKPIRIALLVILLMYLPGVIEISLKSGNIKEGPHKPSSSEVFGFIREHVDENAVISFIRPRVLALFTGRYGFGTKCQDSTDEIANQYTENKVGYILIMEVLKDKNVCEYISQHDQELDTAFVNDDFVLYQFRQE